MPSAARERDLRPAHSADLPIGTLLAVLIRHFACLSRFNPVRLVAGKAGGRYFKCRTASLEPREWRHQEDQTEEPPSDPVRFKGTGVSAVTTSRGRGHFRRRQWHEEASTVRTAANVGTISGDSRTLPSVAAVVGPKTCAEDMLPC